MFYIEVSIIFLFLIIKIGYESKVLHGFIIKLNLVYFDINNLRLNR